MNKKKILAVVLALFCLFIMPKVNADVRACSPFDKSDAQKNLTEVKLHYPNKQAYSPGEKVYLDLKGVERSNRVDIAVRLRSTDPSNHYYYNAYLKNIIGNDTTGAYFIVPDDPNNMPKDQYEIFGFIYYKATDEEDGFGVTPDGEKVPLYKTYCTYYYTSQDDVPTEDGNNSSTEVLSNSVGKFTLIDKKPEAREILESITLEKDYTYFGGKLTFKVKTTEPVNNAYLTFTDRTKQGNLPFFTVNLKADGNSNEFTYTVDAPTYGINNVYEGNYKLEEIQFYPTSGGKLTYNTNKEKAEEYNDKYVEYDLKVTLGKPVTDLVKEAEFELKGTKLVKNEAKVGDKVTVEFDWYYNSVKIRMQSALLTFVDETNNKMFSTYLKETSKNSSIIIPSTAAAGEYKLKTVTITFDSYVGETNTIIIDKDNVGEHKEIFDQKLTIKDDKDAGLYFIAEELFETSYEKIKQAKENAIITINANNKSVIPSQLFDAIKESSKQLVIEYNKNEWVFSGVDIEESKPVDVSMKFYEADKLESAEAIKKVIGDKAVVLEFPENGNLPGKALIRIKDDEVFNKLTGNVYYIYHLDEKENVLNKVAVEVQKSSNGYLEFYINHNSKYVITNEEIKDEKAIGKDDEIAKTNGAIAKAADNKDAKSDNSFLYIIIGVCAGVILVLVLMLVTRKGNKEEAPAEEKKEEAPVAEEPKVEEPKEEAPAEPENKE